MLINILQFKTTLVLNAKISIFVTLKMNKNG